MSASWLPDRCPDKQRHTKCPDGYLSWHAWAAKKIRTHYQVRCATCGLLSIWKKREAPLTVIEVEHMLYPPAVSPKIPPTAPSLHQTPTQSGHIRHEHAKVED